MGSLFFLKDGGAKRLVIQCCWILPDTVTKNRGGGQGKVGFHKRVLLQIKKSV
jgi:hypothetical protein